MGPADVSFANLEPVDAATPILITNRTDAPATFQNALVDNTQALTADVWNIFNARSLLANQKLLQFKITNNSGGASTIETAFMRLV